MASCLGHVPVNNAIAAGAHANVELSSHRAKPFNSHLGKCMTIIAYLDGEE